VSDVLNLAGIEAEIVPPTAPQTLGTLAQASPQAASGNYAVVKAQQFEGISGDITSRDLTSPRLTLVQKSSPLMGNPFNFGDVVVAKDHLLLAAKQGEQGISIIFCALELFYEENKPWGEDKRIFHSLAEVHAAGMCDDMKAKNGVKRVANLLLLVEAPEQMTEGLAAFFTVSVGGKLYAPLLYTVSSVAYTNVVKKLLEFTKANRQFWTYRWKMTFRKVPFDKGEAFQPSIQLLGKLTPEEIEGVNLARPVS
jgi:hypothetical protein